MGKCFAEESGKNKKKEWIFDLSSLFYRLEDCWKFGLKTLIYLKALSCALSCAFGIAVAKSRYYKERQVDRKKRKAIRW